MPKQSFTDVGLRAMKSPEAGQVTVWDGNSPLGVRVSSGGTKTFVVMVGSGQRRTIGKVGVVSLADARTEARRILAEKTLGVTQQTKAKFGEVLPKFLSEQYGDKPSRHKDETKRLLEKHFLPSFEQDALSEITDGDIAKELAKIKSPSTKLHAFRSLRTMFNWAKRPPHRYIRHSPMDGYLPPGKDGKRKRILTDEEVVKVWHVSPPPVKLLYLWGTRRGETGEMSHNWVGEAVLTIPGEYTKNGRAHSIPLLPMARSILETLPRKGRLFGKLGPYDWLCMKRRIIKESGVTAWTLHDLRRTFRSTMGRLGVPRDIAEILLNHVSGSNKSELDEIYDQYDYLPEKTVALEKLEAHLTTLLARH